MTTSTPQFLRAALAALACVLGLLVTSAGFAAEAKKPFDIPAGAALPALKQFAAQSGEQLLYSAEAVQGVTTHAIKGTFTPREALDRMTSGTKLTVVADRKNGALSLVRAADPKGPRVAQEATTPKNPSKVEDGKLVLETYEVTGSRIRGVLGEAAAQPVFTYTRKELDRFGATTFADLQRYIPQLPETNWNRQLETSLAGSPEAALSTDAIGYTDLGTGLRNLGNTSTLVLVDGRRLPKLGQMFATTSAYDLSGIPLAAVERIEVLTDGASAVYGADALAGVLNIILKKEYRGTELSLGYANTFDSDTAERQAQLTHGFAKGRFSLNLSAGWQDTNTLAPRDRWWSATADKRPWGGTDGRATFPDLQGGVRTVSGANLPGLNSPQAAIPVGSTGRNLTIADFANTPVPDRFDMPKYLNYGSRRTESFTVSGRYAFRPWLELFWNGGWRRNTVEAGLPGVPVVAGASTATRVTLPANYPGNPFGVPIYVERALHELVPLAMTAYANTSPSWLAGLRGVLPRDWRYELAVSKRWSEYSATGYSLATGQQATALHGRLNASVNNPDPAQQIILLNDSLSVIPHPSGFYEALLRPRDVGEAPDVWLYDFKADGPLWTLPAGPVQAAVGGEFQENYTQLLATNTIQRLGGGFKRETLGLYAEVQAPLVGPAQKVPLVHKLSAGISARRDSYNDFPESLVPRYSLFYHPVKPVGLRMSYGEGYKVPTLFELYRAGAVFAGSFAPGVLDPLRGGQAVPSFVSTTGGNPDLVPEESKNLNAGLLVEVPFVRGLSFSVDYYDLKHTNRVSADLQAIVNFFPERVVRAAPTAADAAAGWAGVITEIDHRPVNVASFRATGFDFELRYERSFARLGDLLVRVTGTKPEVSELRNRPDSPVIDNVAQSPWRATGLVFLTRGPWETGIVGTYASDYLITTTPVGRVWLWDAQVAYTFDRSGKETTGWRRHIFAGLRVGAQVMNVFDQEPETLRGSSLGNVDPRGRRYQLTLQKRF